MRLFLFRSHPEGPAAFEQPAVHRDAIHSSQAGRLLFDASLLFNLEEALKTSACPKRKSRNVALTDYPKLNDVVARLRPRSLVLPERTSSAGD